MYKNILLSVDLNDESSWKSALPTAVEMCKSSRGKLHIVTVLPSFGMPMVAGYFPADFETKARADLEKALTEFVAKHVPMDVPAEHTVAFGTVYEQILRLSKELDVDLIMLASHRPELKDYLLGPNAAKVVRHANRSVLVVR